MEMIMNDEIMLSERNGKGEKKQKELDGNERLRICMMCPIYLEDKKICDPNRWISLESNEVSREARKGFVRGCGCLIERKVWNKNGHCAAKRW